MLDSETETKILIKNKMTEEKKEDEEKWEPEGKEKSQWMEMRLKSQ